MVLFVNWTPTPVAPLNSPMTEEDAMELLVNAMVMAWLTVDDG